MCTVYLYLLNNQAIITLVLSRLVLTLVNEHNYRGLTSKSKIKLPNQELLQKREKP